MTIYRATFLEGPKAGQRMDCTHNRLTLVERPNFAASGLHKSIRKYEFEYCEIGDQFFWLLEGSDRSAKIWKAKLLYEQANRLLSEAMNDSATNVPTKKQIYEKMPGT